MCAGLRSKSISREITVTRWFNEPQNALVDFSALGSGIVLKPCTLVSDTGAQVLRPQLPPYSVLAEIRTPAGAVQG